MMLKARVFSTDGLIYDLGEILEYRGGAELQDAAAQLELYDNGASHYLLELSDPYFIKAALTYLNQKYPNNQELGREVRKMFNEVEEYIKQKNEDVLSKQR